MKRLLIVWVLSTTTIGLYGAAFSSDPEVALENYRENILHQLNSNRVLMPMQKITLTILANDALTLDELQLISEQAADIEWIKRYVGGNKDLEQQVLAVESKDDLRNIGISGLQADLQKHRRFVADRIGKSSLPREEKIALFRRLIDGRYDHGKIDRVEEMLNSNLNAANR